AAAVLTSLVVARLVVTALVETSCALGGGVRFAAGAVRRTRIALLPRFRIAAVMAAIRAGAEILPRAPVRRTSGKLLVAAEFSLGPISARPVTVTRTIAIGPIALRPVTPFAKTFTTRGVRPLVAELLFGETRSRPCIVVVPTRRSALTFAGVRFAGARIRLLAI